MQIAYDEMRGNQLLNAFIFGPQYQIKKLQKGPYLLLRKLLPV